MKTASRLPLSLLLLSLAATVSAATRTWDGGDATSNWSAANNWNGNTPVAAGDSLVFPAGLAAADRITNNNLAAATLWGNLAIHDGGYSFGGNTIRPGAGITSSFTGTVTFTADVDFTAGPQTIDHSGGDLVFAAASTLSFDQDGLEFHPAVGNLYVDGPLTGTSSGQLRFTGLGKTGLRGAKTFTAGLLVAEGGMLEGNHASSFGNASNTVEVAYGSVRLEHATGIAVPNAFQMTNTGGLPARILSTDGSNQITGPLSLSGTGIKQVDVAKDKYLTLHQITGGASPGGNFRKTGDGILGFSGGTANDFGGHVVEVAAGWLVLSKPHGVHSLNGKVIVRDDGTGTYPVRLNSGWDEQLAPGTQLEIHPYSDVWFNSDETLEDVVLVGSAGLTGSDRPSLFVDTSNGILTLAGPVRATGSGDSYIQRGAASGIVLRIGGSSQTVTVDAGCTLEVNGPVTAAQDNAVWVKAGPGRLELVGISSPFISSRLPLLDCTAGTVGLISDLQDTNVRLRASGQSVDLEAGFATPYGLIGQVEIQTGTLNMGAGADIRDTTAESLIMSGGTLHFDVQRSLPEPGITHDQLQVWEGVSLSGGAQLSINLVPGALPVLPLGTEIVLLKKDGTSPITGQFIGRPEGQLLNLGGQIFALTYKGGDGNDLSICTLLPPTGVTRTWDGGGADAKWMTAANWDNDTLPQPGDALVFPAVAARKANENNFPGYTTFHSITLNAGDYSVHGMPVRLNTELRCTHATGGQSALWNTVLAFNMPGKIAAAAGALEFHGFLLLENKALILDKAPGLGALTVIGHLSGHTAALRKTGGGRVVFSTAEKDYTGKTTLEEGILELGGDDQLGSSAPGDYTLVSPQATLLINAPAPFDLPEVITVDYSGTAGWNLNVQSPADALFSGVLNADVLHLQNTVPCRLACSSADLNNLFKTGAGTLTLEPMAGGSLGTVHIHEGSAIVREPVQGLYTGKVETPLVPAQSRVEINNGVTFAIRLGNPVSVCDLSSTANSVMSVEFANGGTVTGGAAARLTVNQTIHVAASAATAGVDVPIVAGEWLGVPCRVLAASGTPPLAAQFTAPLFGQTLRCESHGGRVEFTADNPPGGLGVLQIDSGSAFVLANWSPTTASLNGGLLGGHGTLGNIESISSGIVSPGASPGILGSYKAIWDSSLTLRMELNGPNMGADYDQFFAFSAPDLGSAALELTAGYDPAPGETFMIVRNVSGAPVAGTFAGAPEGGYVQAPGGKIFQITYAGGDGDDVVLTRVLKDAPQIVEWQLLPPQNPGEDPMNHFVFQGVPGITYMLEFSTDLEKWEDLQAATASIPAGQIIIDLAEPAGDKRKFYRLTLP